CKLYTLQATVLTAVNDLTRGWTARLSPSDPRAQAEPHSHSTRAAAALPECAHPAITVPPTTSG
ncbi:MAG: hypothetical protein OEU94_15830, partial [Aquincola sp.]|nr:hypothetical protein [Aquincola sp.]